MLYNLGYAAFALLTLIGSYMYTRKMLEEWNLLHRDTKRGDAIEQGARSAGLFLALALLFMFLISLPFANAEQDSQAWTKNLKEDRRGAQAGPIKIALIDSGFDTGIPGASDVKVCLKGHYSHIFDKKEGVTSFDPIGHGTSMGLLINEEAEDANYCIMVYGLFGVPAKAQKVSNWIAKSIDMAVKNKAEVINLSIQGRDASFKEKAAMVRASNAGVVMFVAAGNDGKDLNIVCNIYPACYKGIPKKIVIGALDMFYQRASYSNYGSIVKLWFPGGHNDKYGTSFATARATGRFVKYLHDKRGGK